MSEKMSIRFSQFAETFSRAFGASTGNVSNGNVSNGNVSNGSMMTGSVMAQANGKRPVNSLP